MARMLIGTKVREQRKASGFTQAALAERVGISASYLNLIEGNRRNIAGALLKRIADALALPVERLDGAAERRLADELRELSSLPLLAPLGLGHDGAEELAARQPDWARAVVNLHRAFVDRGEAVNALSDRLHLDPMLRDSVHTLITHVAAIRSAAEILESDDRLELADRQRFVSIVAGDSRRLSSVSQTLASFFTRAQAHTRSLSPAEEVDDFVAAHDNHFPTLEAVAESLRREARLQPGQEGARLAAWLSKTHDVRVVLEDAPGSGKHAAGFDPEARTVTLGAFSSGSSRRFLLARTAALLGAQVPIQAIVDQAPELATDTARERACIALAAYVAAAVLMPYEDFRTFATSTRHDIDRLCRRFRCSFEQAAHRLTTLRRPGAEGLRFGFLRANAAGHVSKRFALPNLTLPRHGAACPLWPVHGAFQTPGSDLRAMVEFPGGERFLMMARAIDKDTPRGPLPRRLLSVMLVCDALHADALASADGLDCSSHAPHLPVGHGCRICPRADCAWRQEAPIVDAGHKVAARDVH
ncbi:short-chain fatty acyl-CoA regulator family protein [Variovorax dokdonensis]|uniref:Short-chain fatty acyl-CoA regulator family protein n=1 Tax=Variovorax dokdonensis TaxID=344883 RepID=A0ABT7N7D3_9BURK|nr:helix-turn-helix domain-containing protein [Variovorax dokdonensis]MDM0043837.1 short-chain fatty acyl-CoA regulator family protein [Variovorax dokdonensis]